jgi:hypothetical protein
VSTSAPLNVNAVAFSNSVPVVNAAPIAVSAAIGNSLHVNA